MSRIVVLGGGIAGLSTGLALRDEARARSLHLDLLVLEARDRVGGNIRTDREEGWTIERGPNGFLDNAPTTLALVDRLRLGPRVQQADPSAAKRFLYRRGGLHLVPGGPVSFLRSPILSPRGRLRVLLEPFQPTKGRDGDETIYDFACRRIGREAALALVDPMVSGVFAGDLRELSLASTFPAMARMEAEHGSLTRALLARRRASRRVGPAGPAGTLTSFDEGLEVLTQSLAAELGPALRTGMVVERIEQWLAAGGPSRWAVVLAGGTVIEAEALIVTLPAPRAAEVLRPLDPELAGQVGGIATAGVVVVALGYEAQAIGGAPDGFGFLVGRGEGPRILGCTWDSSLFPGRAPAGCALLRVLIGGAHDPEAVTLSDDALLRVARDDLRTVMGISAEPVLSRVYRHPVGIAQYRVGHGDRLDAIAERLRRWPGLWLAGSSYFGVAMNACIETAFAQAGTVARWLQARATTAPSPAPGSP